MRYGAYPLEGAPALIVTQLVNFTPRFYIPVKVMGRSGGSSAELIGRTGCRGFADWSIAALAMAPTWGPDSGPNCLPCPELRPLIRSTYRCPPAIPYCLETKPDPHAPHLPHTPLHRLRTPPSPQQGRSTPLPCQGQPGVPTPSAPAWHQWKHQIGSSIPPHSRGLSLIHFAPCFRG